MSKPIIYTLAIGVFFQISCLESHSSQLPTKAKSQNKIAIELSCDNGTICPNQTFSLRSLVKSTESDELRSWRYSVVQVGVYVHKIEGFANLQMDDYVYWSTQRVGKGLDTNIQFRDGGFNVLTPKKKGHEYDVSFKKVGIFILTTTWSFKNGVELDSNPIIITVVPPLDDKGKPVVKPEWLKNE